MSEESRKLEAELKAAFARLFPLANERDLPWAPCHIEAFLARRIEQEVEHRTRWFTTRVVKILCEVSPPKNHVEDMARIVVSRVRELEARVACLEREASK